MEQPDGYVVKGKEDMVLRVKKSLYGLRQAPACWNEKINETLSQLGFRRNQAEMGLYFKNGKGGPIVVGLYVDDLLVAARSAEDMEVIKIHLMKAFEMKDLGKADRFLGINIKQTGDTIEFNLAGYIEGMLAEYGMEDCNASVTPMVPQELHKSEMSPTCNGTEYRSLVGKLLFASNTARPDISFAVSTLSRYLKAPKKIHLAAAKRVLKYLKGTKDMGLVYTKQDCFSVMAYCDADWATDKEDRKSTTGFVFMIAGAPVTWKSKKQQTVALSSTEAEYMSLAECAKEAIWLMQVLQELRVPLTRKPALHIDNVGAEILAAHPAYHERTKHIDLRHHFVRDLMAKKVLTLSHVSTDRMVADILTKPLAGPTFRKIRGLTGMC